MGNRSNPTYAAGGPSVYAPKWAREAEARRRRDVRSAYDRDFVDDAAESRHERSSEAEWISGGDLGRFTNLNQDFDATDRHDHWAASVADDQYIDRIGVGPPRDAPDLPHPLRVQSSQRGMLGVMARLGLAVSVAAIAALVAAGKFAEWRNVAGGQRPTEAAIGPTQAQSGIDQPAVPSPQLVAVQSNVRGSSEELPLGLAVEGTDQGVVLVIAGLPTGSTVTRGREFGAGVWRVPAVDIGRTMVRRPRGFVGPLGLIVELRLPDETVADRRSLRLEWVSSAVAVAAPSPVAAAPVGAMDAAAPSRVAAEQINRPTPRLDDATIAVLMKHAEEFIAVGDISAARVLLRRAAEAHDSRAAFALGATYDPLALEKLGVRGTVADVEMARKCYGKARDFGSPEAQGRIEMLATVR